MGASNRPRKGASEGAPSPPTSILRNKTPGPRKKSPHRLALMVAGAKRAISEDLQRPVLPPPPKASKAGRSRVDRTPAAPADDDLTPRYISVDHSHSEDLSQIQDDMRDSDDAPPPEAESSQELRTDVSSEDADPNWESWVEPARGSDRGSDRGYGCRDLVLTDAMFWGEETRQAFARVLENLAGCVGPTGKVSTSDGDEHVADSDKKADASTASVASAEMETNEDCRDASETQADENGGGAESVCSRKSTRSRQSNVSKKGGGSNSSVFSFKSRKSYSPRSKSKSRKSKRGASSGRMNLCDAIIISEVKS